MPRSKRYVGEECSDTDNTFSLATSSKKSILDSSPRGFFYADFDTDDGSPPWLSATD